IRKNNKMILVDIKDYENTFVVHEEQFEHTEDIQVALNKLSEKERELIVMRYLEDMSLKDISKTTSTPLGTIKSKLNRTLKKLRVYMEET
ncbi:sigma-70 family RNA polymerase sigma factor, partial [Clostridium perfringens]|uniref:RNA polymerase sigma factor n=1 Tax=Clostridium perfringens TaxID=1502 RepID=UPI002AC72D18